MAVLHEPHIRNEVSAETTGVNGTYLGYERVEHRHQGGLAPRLKTCLERIDDQIDVVELPRCLSARR